MSVNGELRHLPLESMHEAAGARFGGFAGWSMPITYPAGVLKEHLHTRAHAGLFDISHMKLFELSGSGAGAALARLCPLEPDAIPAGHARYSFLLDRDAGIIDDLIVTRLADRRFMLVANAGNAAKDEAHMRAGIGDLDCRLEPLDRVFLALQGPEAQNVLAAAGLDLSALFFMQGTEPRPGWFASRSGYTGEDGFEIAMPPAEAGEFAGRLTGDDRVAWVGLAARDSLRLEAGLCLHGADIDAGTTPVEAGLLWAIPKPLRGGGGFIGAAALAAAQDDAPDRKRVGLKAEGRQPVRAGSALVDADGTRVGVVTSGGFGPSAGHPVAMGYVRADIAGDGGTPLSAEVRASRIPVAIHPLPFIPHRYRKG